MKITPITPIPSISKENKQKQRKALSKLWKDKARVLDCKILPPDFDLDTDCFGYE